MDHIFIECMPFRGMEGKTALERGVDRENEVIRGVQVMQPTAETQYGEIDLETVQKVAELGQQRGSVKSRFGHPNLSTDSLGTFLGDFKNFRMEGDKAVADLHFDPTAKDTPRGNLSGYLLSLAESRPDRFGMSVVIKADSLVREKKNGKEQLPLVRPTSLLAVDAVDQGAATDGLFSAGVTIADIDPEIGSFSARELVKVRKILQNKESLCFVRSLLQDFSEDGVLPPADVDEPKPKTEDKTMEYADLTLGAIKENRPDLLANFESQIAEDHKKAIDEAFAAGGEEKHKTVLSILSMASDKPYLLAKTEEYPKGFVHHALEKELSADEMLPVVTTLAEKHFKGEFNLSNDGGPSPVQGGGGAVPPQKEEEPKDFMEAVSLYKQKHEVDDATAVMACHKKYPELHVAYAKANGSKYAN